MKTKKAALTLSIATMLCLPLILSGCSTTEAAELNNSQTQNKTSNVSYQIEEADDNDVVTCSGYIDNDGDGICDNCNNNASACTGFIDENNDGICDNKQENNAFNSVRRNNNGFGNCCNNFIDSNGDGICDNHAYSNNYTDDNNDGICDNFGNHNGTNSGYGAKHRYGRA